MRYRGLIWAGLLVADLEKAVAFYKDVLGLKLVDRAEGCVILDAGDGALFELWPTGMAASSPKPPDQQSLRVAFRVDNLDDAILILKERGVEFIGEVGEYKGTKWINFIDPECNRLELKESP